ncbi:MAG: hypothetical protein HY289_07185 [Planctomycetes bacterium]|nr:hypothetical protein [Planctomycetota bacterium]
MRRAFWLFLLAGLLSVNVGCQTPCYKHPLFARKQPSPVLVSPPPPQYFPPPLPVQQSGAIAPLPPGTLPPGTLPPTHKSERVDTPWKPGDTREPEPLRETKPGVQLYAPEKDDEKPNADTAFPPIAQFAVAQKNVYSGLRPSSDGLDWLKKKDVQTVVQLRQFGADDSADRKQVESRSMRYIAFEVTPQTLSKEKADEFIKLVRDGATAGIYIYDDDGSLAGAMWYLYMRYGEFHEDGAARLRAGQLGLRITGEGQHAEMWLAVQKVLSENSK